MAQRISRADASDTEWEKVVRQAEILAPLAQRDRKKRADVDRAAQLLGISTSNAYRLIRLLEGDPRPTALLPHTPGPDAGQALLDPRIETVISEVLERSYCSPQNPKESAVVTEIRGKCRAQGLAQPSRKAVHTRIQAIDLFARLRSREGENAAERAAPRPGGIEATAPNQIWLIDHTLADLILVDRRYRLPIGRPTITLIIDAYTRMCVGSYASREASKRKHPTRDRSQGIRFSLCGNCASGARLHLEAASIASPRGRRVVTDTPALQDDPWSRVALILKDRWASNPVSDEALIRARLAIATAGRLRPKALLFWGVPNAGKTALKVKLLREISQKTFLPNLLTSPVVLMVEAPVEADEARFYEAILQAGHQYVPSGNVRTLLRAVSAFLDELRPDVMILDEAGNLNAYVGARGNVCLNAIRRLCNVHRMTLLGFGTAAAMTALQGDEQLENRFETFELRPLAPPEFRELVELLTGAMPLRQPTSWSVSMLESAYELTGGYVGRASYLVQEASAQAVLSGTEQITETILKSSELSNSLAALRHAGARAGRRTRRAAI